MPQTFKGRYEKLSTHREPFLFRAREAAKYTIPTLIPQSENTPNAEYQTPYQGLGARGVNNLASKLLLTLLPPNSPFFRLAPDQAIMAEIKQQDEEAQTEIEKALSDVERRIMADIEASTLRVSVFEALKHLLVGGNVLLFMADNGDLRVFHLDRFVCVRDPQGLPLEIMTKESTTPEALRDDVIEACDVEKTDADGEPKPVDIFTRIVRAGNKWKVSQEINDKPVPGSEGSYPLEKSPWIPLRLIKIDNEDYGRGFVEEYLGDIISLEELSRAIVQGSVAAAKVLFLIRPNATTKAKDLDAAPNGAIREGAKEDVSVLQLEKYADFRVAGETISKIEQRLAQAFMLTASVQRDAERVTAEEIRLMAGELEDALGGVYSILSQEFQLPLIRVMLHRSTRKNRIPTLKGVNPVITTGLEALGRGHDLRKLDAFLQHLQLIPMETLQLYLKVDDYIKRVGNGTGVDTAGLIRDKDEIEAMQQQQQLQTLIERLGPEAMKQIGGMMQKGQGGNDGSQEG